MIKLNEIQQSITQLCDFFNVDKNISEIELYKVYRRLLVKYHPDKPDGDIEKFRDIQMKYEKLTRLREEIQSQYLYLAPHVSK